MKDITRLGQTVLSGVRRIYGCASYALSVDGKTLASGAAGSLGPDGGGRAGTETLYDLASITKIFTAILAMQFIERGELKLTTKAVEVLGRKAGEQIAGVTVHELLSHISGLAPLRNSMKRCSSRDNVFGVLNRSERSGAGRGVYSDLGYMLLGEILEEISGRNQDWLMRNMILSRTRTTLPVYSPLPASKCAPTGYSSIRRRELRGEPHNEVTAKMEGVSGHAGLFSTSSDLIKIGHILLGDLLEEKGRLLTASSLRRMTTPVSTVLDSQRYGLGLMISPGAITSAVPGVRKLFGHTGHTGTSIFIDTKWKSVSVLLTNRDQVNGDLKEMQRTRVAFHTQALEEAKRISMHG